MSRAVLATPVPVASSELVLAARDALVVDLRAPAEHAEDHLPGALNVPLFDDEERALVGTLYRRASPQVAFEAGRRIAREHIGGLVARIAAAASWDLPAADLERRLDALTEGGIEGLEAGLEPRAIARLPERAVVLHCWRGGLRSRSVVAFLRALGLERAVGLAEGYRGYRRGVLHQLETWQAPPSFVLRGLTGVGKTLVLRELERIRPGWTLDLEGLAGHRSSVLGMVGLAPCTQKTFETRLAARLRAGLPGRVVLEGESRKVGDAIVPPSVWRALEQGVALELVADTPRRVRVLLDDYLAREENRAPLRAQLPFIERRLGPRKWDGALVALLDRRRDAELVELLLEHYYDPLYRHSEQRHAYAGRFDARDPAACAAELARWIEARGGGA